MPRANPLVTHRTHAELNARNDELLRFYEELSPDLQNYVRALSEELSAVMASRGKRPDSQQRAGFGLISTLELLVQTYRFTGTRQIRKPERT